MIQTLFDAFKTKFQEREKCYALGGDSVMDSSKYATFPVADSLSDCLTNQAVFEFVYLESLMLFNMQYNGLLSVMNWL